MKAGAHLERLRHAIEIHLPTIETAIADIEGLMDREKNARDLAALRSLRDRLRLVADGLLAELRADEPSTGVTRHLITIGRVAGLAAIAAISVAANVSQILDRYWPIAGALEQSVYEVATEPKASASDAEPRSVAGRSELNPVGRRLRRRGRRVGRGGVGFRSRRSIGCRTFLRPAFFEPRLPMVR